MSINTFIVQRLGAAQEGEGSPYLATQDRVQIIWCMLVGSKRKEWGDGEEPNRPNKGDALCK